YFLVSGANPEVADLEVQYFRYLAVGGGALVLTNALSSFYTGRGMTRVVMLVQVGGTLVNVVLDYLLIFGNADLGIPQMGIKGAAIATAAASWFDVLVFTLLLRFAPAYRLFDATQTIFVGALKGAGDTVFILMATTTISVLFVTIGRLGQVYGEWGLFGWWWVLTGWLFTLALVYLARFLGGR